MAETGLLTFEATGGGGSLLGFPFRTTTQIPINLTVGSSSDCSEMYFSSDWDEVWIGEEDTLRIEVSGEATYWTGAGAALGPPQQTALAIVMQHQGTLAVSGHVFCVKRKRGPLELDLRAASPGVPAPRPLRCHVDV